MPLLEILKSAPDAVYQMSIEQIVSNAGNGVLKDNSVCSEELRTYLSQVTSEQISSYIEHCLSTSFNKSGMVLQDLVNELGRRLDYDVRDGLYQGTTKEIGFDGLWLSPEGHEVIVEVKTTDAYRISLDTIARYRARLLENSKISVRNSILIVVGRQDTGDLESQIRGSRHAWDIRLISAEALIKVARIKERTEEPETGPKIRSLLAPMEYTRLDKMIDIIFATAQDVEIGAIVAGSELGASDNQETEPPPSIEETSTKTKGVWQVTASSVLQQKRALIIEAIAQRLDCPLIKKSRATYWNPSRNVRVACTLSKRYAKNKLPYWYGYQPQWKGFLEEGADGFIIYGAMDLPFAFALPQAKMASLLEALNTTTEENGSTYWHIQIAEPSPNEYRMLLPKSGETLDLSPYKLLVPEISRFTESTSQVL